MASEIGGGEEGESQKRMETRGGLGHDEPGFRKYCITPITTDNPPEMMSNLHLTTAQLSRLP